MAYAQAPGEGRGPACRPGPLCSSVFVLPRSSADWTGPPHQGDHLLTEFAIQILVFLGTVLPHHTHHSIMSSLGPTRAHRGPRGGGVLYGMRLGSQSTPRHLEVVSPLWDCLGSQGVAALLAPSPSCQALQPMLWTCPSDHKLWCSGG